MADLSWNYLWRIIRNTLNKPFFAWISFWLLTWRLWRSHWTWNIQNIVQMIRNRLRILFDFVHSRALYAMILIQAKSWFICKWIVIINHQSCLVIKLIILRRYLFSSITFSIKIIQKFLLKLIKFPFLFLIYFMNHYWLLPCIRPLFLFLISLRCLKILSI